MLQNLKNGVWRIWGLPSGDPLVFKTLRVLWSLSVISALMVLTLSLPSIPFKKPLNLVKRWALSLTSTQSALAPGSTISRDYRVDRAWTQEPMQKSSTWKWSASIFHDEEDILLLNTCRMCDWIGLCWTSAGPMYMTLPSSSTPTVVWDNIIGWQTITRMSSLFSTPSIRPPSSFRRLSSTSICNGKICTYGTITYGSI